MARLRDPELLARRRDPPAGPRAAEIWLPSWEGHPRTRTPARPRLGPSRQGAPASGIGPAIVGMNLGKLRARTRCDQGSSRLSLSRFARHEPDAPRGVIR